MVGVGSLPEGLSLSDPPAPVNTLGDRRGDALGGKQ
jgi:hypothetical protein